MSRFLVFVIFGLILLTFLNLVSEASPSPERQVFQGMLDHADQIDALTIGSSISTAVDFDTLNLHGWHMWTPSSDLLEDEYILRAAANELPKLRVVFIAIPPVAFQWLSTARSALQVRRQSYRATGPDVSDGLIDGDWRDFVITWALPLVRDDRWRDPVAAGLESMGLPITVPSGLMARQGRWLPLLRPADLAARRAAAKETVPGVLASVLATVTVDPEAPARLAAAVPRMARFLAKRGVRAVFFTPPVSRDYEAIFDLRRPRQFVDGREEMRRIADANGLLYIDLSRDPGLARELDRFYYDPIHLTVAGSARFTTRLRTELAARDVGTIGPESSAPQ